MLSDPRIEFKDEVIRISYDILNAKSSEYYDVDVEISDDGGEKIEANTFSGDIGKGVKGGSNKSITWDLTADQILMNKRIYFELVARTMEHSEMVKIGRSETNLDASVIEAIASTNLPSTNVAKQFSGAGIVIQSLFIPGLGLSRVTGKPHWLRGVAVYGCVAGSVVLNRQSVRTYNGIQDYPDFEDRMTQIQKSINQDDISEVLAYTAIGLWATDIIWNLIGISSFKKRISFQEIKGLSLHPGFDHLTYTPTLGINYRF